MLLLKHFEANHNKDYSVVKTFTVVPLNSGIAVLKNTTKKFVYISFRYSGENRQRKVIEELFINENIKTCPVTPHKII